MGRGRPSACGGGAGLCHAKVAFVGALSPGRARAARRHLMVFNPLNPGEDRDPCANPVPEALSRPQSPEPARPSRPPQPDGDSEGAGDAGFVRFLAPSEEGTQVAAKAAASPRAGSGRGAGCRPEPWTAPHVRPTGQPPLCGAKGPVAPDQRHRTLDTNAWAAPASGRGGRGGGSSAPTPHLPTPRPPTPSWGQPIPSTPLRTWRTESSV